MKSNKTKKSIKINFKYFWEGFDPNDNFFTDLLKKEYNVIISDNPDYVFYSVYPEIKEGVDISKKGEFIRKISPSLYRFLRKAYPRMKNIFKSKEKMLKPPEGNFKRFLYASEHVKPNMNECDLAFSSTYDEELLNHPRHLRFPIHRLTSYNLRNRGIPSARKKINFRKIKKEKTKFCNFIYSNEVKPRNDFFKILNKYKRVDSPGRCMNNMPAIGHDNPRASRKSFNWAKEKLRFLKDYKFTIGFENFSKPGWVTEKLTHPMLVNSIPIYFGHEDVKKEFNTKSFINYTDFKNMKDFVDFIIRVDNDDKLYEKILKEPWYLENKPNESMDDFRILKAIKKVIDQDLKEKGK